LNAWLIASVVLVVAIVPCLAVCLLADATEGLPALEVAGTLAVSALIALAEGFHRQPFIDLALVLAVLAIIGALAYARLMETDA
jgi:multisubunit Na+/H+ antiporter MnhF subunit